nr:retrotransposon protein, putative, unclassified [Tanacetum cinerariifolium]
LVEIILFIVDSRCSKHMMGNLKFLTNFVEKFLGTVKFGNDQIAPILGYGDLGNDLLTGPRRTDLYPITLQDTISPNPICLMAKATSSQAWLWHRCLSHLNFDTINLLSKNDIVIGINHQTSVARTPEQNGLVERRNRTLVEAARIILSAAKVPLYFWAEAIATTCFTQNRSLVIPRHEKTPYHIINDRKPSVKFFYIFGSLCDIVRDGENLDKMKEKAETVITSNELDFLFSLLFDELLNGSSQVVSKSSAVTTADAPNQCQQQTTPLNNQTTPGPTCQVPTQAPTVTSTETLIKQKRLQKMHKLKMTNLSTSFVHRYKIEGRHHHSLEQVIGNPSQSVRTRCQLESDGEMCMFALTVSRTKPKNIKEAMADSDWIESMQEELHQFDRLDPDGFVDPFHPDKVYRLKKALYGLKQAPRAWYDELSTFLVSKGFSKGSIDPTLFITKRGEDILLVQICVDDIIFGSTNPKLSKQFEKLMHSKFEMSMMGELEFFLGIQIHQSPRGIFINPAKYAQEILIKHEAEYVSLSVCCAQVLWMRTQLTDYGFHCDKIPMYCDSKEAIAISCNPVQHSCTKHINVRYHFIKEKIEKGIVELFFVGTEYQLADLFTKALSEERFKYLVRRLGMRCLTPEEVEVLANESA